MSSVPFNNRKQASQPSSKAKEKKKRKPRASPILCFSDEAFIEMHCGILLLTNDELVIGGVQPINSGYLSNPPAYS